jgi:hypothetical protein
MRQGSCLANFHAIANAMKIYYQDERAYPPPLWERDENGAYRYHGGVGTLYPDYLTSQKSLVCPEDDAARRMSWENLLQSRYSSYDAEYNFYGYDPFAPEGQTLAIRDPQSSAHQSLIALWRKGGLTPKQYPMLANPDAPDHTIITLCRWHEPLVKDPARQVRLVIRVGGSAGAVKRGEIDYVFQQEL